MENNVRTSTDRSILGLIMGVIMIIAFGLTGTLLLLVSSPITMMDIVVDIIIIPGIGIIFGICFIMQKLVSQKGE